MTFSLSHDEVDLTAPRLYPSGMAKGLSTGAQKQTADAVLMIRPANFSSNAETVSSNHFQATEQTGPETGAAAQREFDSLSAGLAAAGIRVHAFEGKTRPQLPDEVFPNNWLSLHADGTAVLYPLLAPSRRGERRPELLDALQERHGYRLERIVDLTALEDRGMFLEGTGSLVLDRARRIAYACRSPRTHPEALAEFGRRLDYEIVAFDAVDRAHRAIYHTNVLLSVGTSFAALCTSAIPDAAERLRLIRRLEQSREIVDLSFDQLHSFAGNMLALAGPDREVIALSAAACEALSSRQITMLESHGRLIAAGVGTIEKYGGGSVRCMLAEVHLPRSGSGTGSGSGSGTVPDPNSR
jgi:hypothetical protein